MRRHLLDTNMISFYVRRQSAALTYRMQTITASALAISVITGAELRWGLERRPRDARARVATERLPRTIDIYAWTSECAAVFIGDALRQQQLGRPLSARDALIAVPALALDRTLVTNDAAFRHVEGRRVEDRTKGPHPA